MTLESNLRASAPGTLVGARNMTHQAMQLLSKAAMANVKPQPDTSHTNMGWSRDLGAFLTQPIPSGQDGKSHAHIGLDLAKLTLLVIRDHEVAARLDLAGVSDRDALAWLDDQLAEAGLKPASPMTLFYDMPSAVTGITTYDTEGLGDALTALAAWFALADDLLTTFADNNGALRPGPSPVRCWPHHFDIATYVSLEEGDFETAKGIGVGLSPGDGNYEQPYFYINPFPGPDVATLPEPPAPGHWHSEGFVGAIATGDEVLTLSDIETGMAGFIDRTFAIGREKLGV